MTDPTADAKLLPCPFCGGEAGITLKHPLHPPLHPWYELACHNHECPFRPKITFATSEKEPAIARWNTRPQPAPGGDANERNTQEASGTAREAPSTSRDAAASVASGGIQSAPPPSTQPAPPEGEPDWVAIAFEVIEECNKYIARNGFSHDEVRVHESAAPAIQDLLEDRLGLAARPKVDDALEVDLQRVKDISRLTIERDAAREALAEREAELVKARSDLRLLREYAGLPARIAKRQNASGDGLGRLWKLLDEWDMRDARLAGSEYETGHAARHQKASAEPAAGEDG